MLIPYEQKRLQTMIGDQEALPCFSSQLPLKSFQVGLAEPINASFLLRVHPLICFSREIAACTFSVVSN